MLMITPVLVSCAAALALYTAFLVLLRSRTARQQQCFDYSRVPIPARTNLDVANTPARPYRPWKTGKFVMTMGIRRTVQEEWLDLDDRYWVEQALRADLLENHHDEVTRVLPGSEPACIETLEMIVSYLTRRFPHLFFYPGGKKDHIHNALTEKTFRIREPFDIPPLDVAAQLVMEDLNLLIQGFGPDPEQHYLAASFSMAPAGWYLRERIGWPLYKIHTPVPLWEEKLRSPVEKAFLRMKADELISRHNFFIQTDDTLFQQEPFGAEGIEPPRVEDIRIRHERQTLRRLPKTRAILFTVRTYMLPLKGLEEEPESIRNLMEAIKEMHPEMARYKGRHIWGQVIEDWCRLNLGYHELRQGPV